MTSRRSVLTKMMVAAALAFAGATAQAADRMAELQERFKGRFAEVRRLKDAGKIGETSTGLLAEVKGVDAGQCKVVSRRERRPAGAVWADRQEGGDDAPTSSRERTRPAISSAARRAIGLKPTTEIGGRSSSDSERAGSSVQTPSPGLRAAQSGPYAGRRHG